MTAEHVRELLRLRAECLRVPDEIIDRALARCARLEARAQRHGISTRATAVRGGATVASLGDAPQAAATVPSLGDAPAAPPDGVTVPSLGDAEPVPQRSGALPPGRIIAGYRIEGLLGKGGMGAVYRAIQLSMMRPVAFKVLAPRLAGDPTFVGRFKREARAAGRLIHPNLITVHEAGDAAGLVFFSMELVEGRSLKDIIRERGRLPPAEALGIARQVLEALRFAHGKGVIHRDIKPDNVMLTAAGQAKIADLGLSRIEEGHPGESSEMFQTEAGSFMGTPHYMAPEQSRDAHAADARADLYALGATLYHMVCGKTPFDGATPMEVMVAAQKQPLAFPEPAPPKPVRELIARLMEKDPARRPADAEAALALLDRIAGPPAQPAARRPWWRRLAWIAATLAIAAMAALAWQEMRRRDAERAWQDLHAAAQAEAEAMRWSAALDRLAQARPGLDPRYTPACDEAATRIAAAWDAWAGERFAATEQSIRGHLAASRFSEALDLLKAVPAAWRSPSVERRIEDLLIAAGEAAARAAERKREEGERPAAVQGLLELRERRRRLSAEAWQRATIDPPDSARPGDGAQILSGSGSARVPLPTGDRLAAIDVAIRVAWRNPDPAARLEIALGAGTKAVFTPGAAVLERGSQRLPLAGGFDGQAMHLGRREGGGYVVMVRDGGPVPLRVEPGSELVLRWQLAQGEATVAIGGGKR